MPRRYSRRYVGRASATLARNRRTRTRYAPGNPSRKSWAIRDQTRGPLTTERDFTTDYSKRRPSPRARRNIKRKRTWTRKVVKAVREATLGSQHIIRRSYAPNFTTPVSTKGTFSFTMYGLNGDANTSVNTNNDVGSILFNGSPTEWNDWESPIATSTNQKLHSYHATLEFSMSNTGTNDAWVEVYHIRARRRVDFTLASPDAIYQRGFLKQGTAYEPDTGTSVGTPLLPSDLGVTPFQNAMFCRTFQITKRQKFKLAVGAEISFTIHDARPRTFAIGSTKPYTMDSSTSGILVQQYGVSTNTAEAAAVTTTLQCIRRYRMKMAEDDNPTDARVT